MTSNQLFDLTGKTALVTGGSRGLDLQMAHALGEAGAKVVLSSRKAEDLEHATAELKAAGIHASWIAADCAKDSEITRLADAMQTDIHWVKDLYGVLEKRGQTPVARPLAALNTALATDGVVIRVTGKATKPINFIYLHKDETSDAALHNVIKVEAGAEMTSLETGPAAARFSKTLEVDVADDGAFHHVRAQGRDHERRAVTHCFARIGTRSTFKSFTLTFNGVLTRNECIIEIIGDDAVRLGG